jgi:hypothetical protein
MQHIYKLEWFVGQNCQACFVSLAEAALHVQFVRKQIRCKCPTPNFKDDFGTGYQFTTANQCSCGADLDFNLQGMDLGKSNEFDALGYSLKEK